MRKADIELLEVRLEPLQTARDRHESEINSMKRATEEMRVSVKDLEKSTLIHDLAIEQGLASIRSLLQRANKKARETGIIEDEPNLDTAPPESHTGPVSPVRPRQIGNRRVI